MNTLRVRLWGNASYLGLAITTLVYLFYLRSIAGPVDGTPTQKLLYTLILVAPSVALWIVLVKRNKKLNLGSGHVQSPKSYSNAVLLIKDFTMGCIYGTLLGFVIIIWM